MIKASGTYHLQEEELIVLSAFFLAIPLPPVMGHELSDSESSVKEKLPKITQSLLDKKFIFADTGTEQKNRVEPELAKILRGVAYGNQFVHIFKYQQGEPISQFGYYRHQDNNVMQELSDAGMHTLSFSKTEIGMQKIEGWLRNAPQGSQKKKIRVSVDTWHYALSSLVIGVSEDVLKTLDSRKEEVSNQDNEAVIEFIRDVIDAKLIIEVTCVYERIEDKSEKASFVVTDHSNWLLSRANSENGQEMLWAIEVSKQSLHHALNGLYMPLGIDNASARSSS